MPRPPYPAVSGLWGKPTIINNVETLNNVPVILAKGAAAWASKGTEKSKGTKTFALTGKVQNTGLIEVELGMSLRKVIFEIGGGIPDGKEFKAAQTGGPSGGCLPKESLDRCQNAFARRFRPHVDVTVVGIADESVSPPLEFTVQLIEQDVTYQG